ncbi:MAG: hypothetical protein ABIW03_06175 [Sphingomicrobium sp.]
MKLSTRVGLAACVALAAITPASANHSWGGYHWARTSNPFTLKVNTALTSQWTSPVNGAISDWTSSTVLNLTGQGAPAGTSAKRCSAIIGQVLVCNDSYGQRGWLGIASITLSGGHINSGTTKLNDTYFNTAKYNTPAWRNMVACQEIGHDFGLDHQDEVFDNYNLGTCMDYTNAPGGGSIGTFNYGPNNEHPNTHDYDQLKSDYQHLDSSTTISAATNFGIRQVGQPVRQAVSIDPGNSPAEWGRAIHNDAQGRPNVYVRTSNGVTVLTHVFWAIGEGPGRSN